MTHKIVLLSGVEAEFKELTTYDQELLTKNDRKPFSEKLIDMLLNAVVRVGDVRPTAELFKGMLSGDKKKLLTELRMASLDFAPTFDFDYEYEEDGDTKKFPLSIPLKRKVVTLVPSEENPEEMVEVVTEEVGFSETPYPFQVQNYSEVDALKTVFLELPRSKKRARFTLLDGYGEARTEKIKSEDISSSTTFLIRDVRTMEPTDKGEVPIVVRAKDLHILDGEAIRKAIKQNEGNVDTEVRFEHPVTGKPVIVDMLQTVAFFFPSQAI